MSTLVAQTISNGTVSTSSANVIQGSAKAWVNFAGLTNPGTINNSFNVSSVTYNSQGSYVVNFTTALANANYAVAGSATGDSGNFNSRQIVYGSNTTSSCAIYVVYGINNSTTSTQTTVIFMS